MNRSKQHRMRLMLAIFCAACAGLGAAPGDAIGDPVPPPGFSDTLVTTVFGPTDMAFTPDGRMVITKNSGLLYVYQNGTLLPPVLDIRATTCVNFERGMMGIAVDPDFAANHHVYIFYTFKKDGSCETNNADKPVNRVSRFTLADNNTVDPKSEVVLLDNIPSYTGSHNAGDVDFGKDGYLYVTVGDGFCDYVLDSGCGLGNDAARDTAALTGKVLRITKDGGIPPTNPLQGPNDVRCNVTGRTTIPQQCKEIYAWGLRNPFRIAFDPNAAGTHFHINDVGQDLWEEVNLGQAGANYGYNTREGHCWQGSSTDCGPPPPEWGLTDPIYDYSHSSGCTAITAGAFVPVGVWPEEFDGAYLYMDMICGALYRLAPGAGGSFTAVEVMAGIDTPITATFGPHGSTQALYYIAWGSSPSQIRRLEFSGQANRPPVARATADPTYGSLPLTVDFDATTSSDPDDDPLTYEWDFGDGSAPATGATVSHTYTTAVPRTVTLTVRDDRTGEGTDSVEIQPGNTPPVPVIDEPRPTKTFRVGEQIAIEGEASDPEEGDLPASALTFEVIKRHDTHFHPFFPPTQGNSFEITAPPPEDIASTQNSHLEIMLTATDSQGLSSTVTQNLNPTLVNTTFETSPSGLQLLVAGNSVTSPRTIVSWHGWDLDVDAPAQSSASNQPQAFESWSDGGGAAHTITTGDSPATYRATFNPAGYPRPKAATPASVKFVPAHRECTAQNAEHGPPLANPSCSPPELESDTLTVGTPDKNGFGANGIGRATFKLFCTDGDTPPCSTEGDTEDVSVDVAITDVRCSTTNAACPEGPGSDYIGRLLTVSAIRITDRLNGVYGSGAGTTADLPFDIPLDCVATSETNVGSSCSATTTADALYPGVAREQSRSIWQLGPFEVYDAGPNGTGYEASCPPSCGDGDEQAFLKQGLFVP